MSEQNLNPRIAGVLCYAGFFVTGLLFLLVGRRHRFILFHAWQSILACLTFVLLNAIFGIMPVIGWICNLLFVPLSICLWIFLMSRACRGHMYKIPYVGDVAESLSQRNI
jgi:uncharacterized membrane protein